MFGTIISFVLDDLLRCYLGKLFVIHMCLEINMCLIFAIMLISDILKNNNKMKFLFLILGIISEIFYTYIFFFRVFN